MGNNDWNVYCLAEQPLLDSNITVEFANSQIVLGDTISGFGRLILGKADASVKLFFVKPNGTLDETQVSTIQKGIFSFTCTPDATGNWTVVAQWKSDKSYYSSAWGMHVPFEVVAPEPPDEGHNTNIELPGEYVYAALVILVLAATVFGGFMFFRRAKRK